MHRVPAVSAPHGAHPRLPATTLNGAAIDEISLRFTQPVSDAPACCRAAGCVGTRCVATTRIFGPARLVCLCRYCRAAAASTALLMSMAYQPGNAVDVVGGTGIRADIAAPVVPRREPSADADTRAGEPGGERIATPAEAEEAALGFGATYIGAVGRADVDDDALSSLRTGAHEPNRDGIPLHLFTLSGLWRPAPAVEVHGSVMGRSTRGERGSTEVEEAYALIGDGNHDVQWKMGWFFTEVGRLNAQHFEDADFVDKAVILTRLFGEDQLSNAGLRLLWPVGPDGASTIAVGVQDSKGETASSFLAEAGAEISGHALIERHVDSADDLLYHARWATRSLDASGARWELGISGLTGPNASGSRTRTDIVGLDVSATWNSKYEAAEPGAVRWHAELLARRYEAGDPDDPSREVLKDRGMVSQWLWAYRPNWVAGVRLEYVDGNGDNRDPERDERTRASLNITWNAGKAATLRLQYNRDAADHLEGEAARSVWLQTRVTTGAHDEHH